MLAVGAGAVGGVSATTSRGCKSCHVLSCTGLCGFELLKGNEGEGCACWCPLLVHIPLPREVSTILTPSTPFSLANEWSAVLVCTLTGDEWLVHGAEAGRCWRGCLLCLRATTRLSLATTLLGDGCWLVISYMAVGWHWMGGRFEMWNGFRSDGYLVSKFAKVGELVL